MNIAKADFDRAAGQVQLTAEQAQRFWAELQTVAAASSTARSGGGGSRFDLAHLAYYFGALIVLGAMGWFMTTAWEAFGGAGVCLIASGYAAAFAVSGSVLWRKPETRTPGGLLVTLAVGMTPLAVYGLERWLGWWPDKDPGEYAGFHEWVRGGWMFMEISTVIVAVVALCFVRFPFLTAPLAFTLWYMSMDLAPLLSPDGGYSYELRLHVSLWFGVGMLLVAYLVDLGREWKGPDYGFWLSLFGLMAFWGGLSMMRSSNEWSGLLYGLVNVGLMLLGVVFDRRAAVVFGALGVNFYIGHLAWGMFKDSLLFPFVLSAFGLLIIVAGVLYQRRRTALRGTLLDLMPASWRRLLPARAPAE